MNNSTKILIALVIIVLIIGAGIILFGQGNVEPKESKGEETTSQPLTQNAIENAINEKISSSSLE